jgi:hypothetical protein
VAGGATATHAGRERGASASRHQASHSSPFLPQPTAGYQLLNQLVNLLRLLALPAPLAVQRENGRGGVRAGEAGARECQQCSCSRTLLPRLHAVPPHACQRPPHTRL